MSEDAKVLSDVPLSSEKSFYSEPEQKITCEINTAVNRANTALVFKEESDHNAKADQLLSRCLGIYACSKSAHEFIQQKFGAENSKIQIAFADFKKLGIGKNTPDASHTVQAMYLANTNGIYIDSNLTDGHGVCSILYHELIHRFDRAAKKRINPLRVEYRAYYEQVKFSAG